MVLTMKHLTKAACYCVRAGVVRAGATLLHLFIPAGIKGRFASFAGSRVKKLCFIALCWLEIRCGCVSGTHAVLFPPKVFEREKLKCSGSCRQFALFSAVLVLKAEKQLNKRSYIFIRQAESH